MYEELTIVLRHWICLATFAVSVGYIFYRLLNQPRKLNLPPGPWFQFPYLGYLPFIRKDYLSEFEDLRKTYGPIYRLNLGQRSVLVLSDFPSLKDAFLKNAFLGRPPSPPNQVLKGATAVSTLNGDIWREQRRFLLHKMRDLGYGKTRMEDHMKEELSYLTRELSKYNGRALNLRRFLVLSVFNNISTLVLQCHIDYHDPKGKILDEAFLRLLQFFRPTSIHAWFPWLKDVFFYFKLWDYDKMLVGCRAIDDFLEKGIDEHRASLDPNNIRDYADIFLLQMEERKCEEPKTSFNRKVLKGNITTLIAAGSTTVRIAIEWALLAMAEYLDVQKRIQREIEELIGHERTPCWEDHTHLVYTKAVLTEIHRWKTIFPINLLRYTTEDTSVMGYDVPRGTTVIANIWAVHRDPDYWEEPSEFRPERFLTPDGKEFVKHESWIPFSFGKRACPADTFANAEVFLYVTTLLQKFDIRFPEGKRHSFEANLGVTYDPIPYELCLVPRA